MSELPDKQRRDATDAEAPTHQEPGLPTARVRKLDYMLRMRFAHPFCGWDKSPPFRFVACELLQAARAAMRARGGAR